MADEPDLPKPTPEQVRDAFATFADIVSQAGGAMVVCVEVADDAWQAHVGKRASQLVGMAELLSLGLKQRCLPASPADRKEP